MKFLVLFTIILVQRAVAKFLCYCNTNHPLGAVIRDCPDTTSGHIIGIVWQPDSVITYTDLSDAHCVAAFSAHAPTGWAAVYYNKQNLNTLGYLKLDSGFKQLQCTGSLMFNINALQKSPKCHHNIGTMPPGLVFPSLPPGMTTTATTTKLFVTIGTVKPLPFVTIPTTTKPVCDGHKTEIGIKQHKTIFNDKSRHCPGVTIANEEGVIMALCKAPEVKQWKQDRRVMDNCKAIPKYTPVGSFKGNSMAFYGLSGIFMECTVNSIKIARQVCSNKYLEMVEIPSFLASSYHVIQW